MGDCERRDTKQIQQMSACSTDSPAATGKRSMVEEAVDTSISKLETLSLSENQKFRSPKEDWMNLCSWTLEHEPVRAAKLIKLGVFYIESLGITASSVAQHQRSPHYSPPYGDYDGAPLRPV